MVVPHQPRPMMVVDNAHVNYRVHASGKRVSAREGLAGLGGIRAARSFTTVPALRGVTFTASEGETIGVVGHNGSGKSTLFRAMSGLIPTAEGKIWARDRPVLLGVNAALVPELSGENNIKLGLLAMGFTAEEAAAQVDEIADFAELNEFINHPMRTYSSGMGARLKFAIASARAHSILLVDEALAVGDRRFRTKSEDRIRELRDSAGLVMIVSHSVGSLRETCERVLWVHKGELRADGPAGAVISEYVKWTKQPGGAVGAASSASRGKKPAQTAAPVAATIEHDGSAHGAEPSARDVARRDRYRQSSRERIRRSIITSGITLGAMILAVGAGAAIALLTQTSVPDDRSTSAPSGSVVEELPAPEIATFAAAQANVTCETEEAAAEVHLSWLVNGASAVAVAAGAAEVDALDSPLLTDQAALMSDVAAPYDCAAPTLVYTLTAENADGTRTSASVTVVRDPIETEAPVDDSDTGQVTTPSTAPSAPATTAPEPTTEPEPVPTTDPEPEPTTEPEPEPEPTDASDAAAG